MLKLAIKEIEDKNNNEALSSDSDSLDDDILRSVDAFSDDELEDRGQAFFLESSFRVDERSLKNRNKSTNSVL